MLGPAEMVNRGRLKTIQRFGRCVVAFLAGMVFSGLAGWAAVDGPTLAPPSALSPASGLNVVSDRLPVVPLREQPFYPELLTTAARWNDAPLGSVVGASPEETLLNFYAAMSRVKRELDLGTAERQGGLFWSPAAQLHIDVAEAIFSSAVEALDSSVFPESVRVDMADEAAMQLKQVLDYVLTHSNESFTIPASTSAMRANGQQPLIWTIPETSISLSDASAKPLSQPGFRFSPDTVKQVSRMYAAIQHEPVQAQPFATPGWYSEFALTPGYLAPPKWYLLLPGRLRGVLEASLNDQTLLQIVLASLVLTLYALAVVWIVRQLLQTYGHWGHLTRGLVPAWGRHHVGWYRVALALPLAPLVEFADVIVDDYVNFTGEPLLVITYVTSAIYYLSCGVFFFYLFEALGRSLSSWLARNSDRNSDLQMRRISTLVVPLGRVLGCFVIVFLIYKLLVDLGASNTVLAFSAVPGLAVGLGASKILGNVFGGLSIQTDRPVRIGEFCRIGGNLGYVTKIGLRSLEMQTLESKVTIPNLIADEQMIVNYSRRGSADDNLSMQSLDVRIPLEGHFSPEQITDLLALVRQHMIATAELHEPLVSIERADQDRLTVICLATVVLQDWTSYLAVRELLLLRLQELVTQVQLSSIVVGVSYDTTDEQLRRLPELIRSIVERDSGFVLHCCRLMRISEFSYDFAFRLHSSHSSLDLFQDAIDRLNKDLLACFSAEGIVIPFPTQVEISAAR